MDFVYLKRGKDRRKPVNNLGGGGGSAKNIQCMVSKFL